MTILLTFPDSLKFQRFAQNPAVDIIYGVEENLGQHRTEIVVQMRSQIFRQIVQKFCRHTDVCQKIYVQDAGKYASICAAKPSGGLCAVLP